MRLTSKEKWRRFSGTPPLYFEGEFPEFFRIFKENYTLAELRRGITAGNRLPAEREGKRPKTYGGLLGCRPTIRTCNVPAPSAKKKAPFREHLFWRMERDSNSREALDPYTLSRRAPSTARPSIRNCFRIMCIYDRKTKNKSLFPKIFKTAD